MKSISLLNRLSILATVVSLTVQAANVPPEIRNLKVQQRPGTYLVDVTFDLVDPDSLNGVLLSLEASSDNGANFNLPAKTVTGDTGLIKPGTGKKMVWDAFTDWPDKYTPNAKVRVVADDSLPQGPTQAPDGFVWIPPGKYMMGSPVDDPDAFSAEQPQHQVLFAPGFWMSDHEVTQGEFQFITGSNPSAFKGDPNRPVEFVHMGEVLQYCQILTKNQRAAGQITGQQEFRPPTEAEWEYACRAGSSGLRYGNIKDIAWWFDNSGGETKPVKQKLPNAWGLYDMIGNVSEWCLDSYKAYSSEILVNPRDPTFDDTRVIRGGNWGDPTRNCRAAYRTSDGSGSKRIYLGFRVILGEIR